MFEYLMPSLWMRSYPDTLIARTLTACVAMQRAFGEEYGIPWGISESGWAGNDDHGHYQYQAFGIPPIALKWDAVAGPVVSPYSTFLALGIDPVEAMRNLSRMAKMGWSGAYGFYEAADYAGIAQNDQAGAGVDGPPPGHVAAGRCSICSTTTLCRMVPRQCAPGGDAIATARKADA